MKSRNDEIQYIDQAESEDEKDGGESEDDIEDEDESDGSDCSSSNEAAIEVKRLQNLAANRRRIHELGLHK